MMRTDGLVRRAVRTRETSGDGSSQNSRTTDDNHSEQDKDLADQNVTMDEGDDKATRLTLMEEVLLLGLKDKEVTYSTME